jgi:sugar phosphate isomerase/epimerase
VTTDDDEVRARSWDALQRIAELCAGLGGSVMVFGSPRQRGGPGISAERARERLIRGLGALAPVLEQMRVKLLVEALSPEQTNVVNTMAEARSVIEAVGSPWVRGMFDFHNAREEKASPAQLLDQGFDLIEHVHLNNAEGSYPRAATAAYREAFDVLRRRGYGGWVSLEIFHFDEPPQRVLETTMRTLRALQP